MCVCVCVSVCVSVLVRDDLNVPLTGKRRKINSKFLLHLKDHVWVHRIGMVWSSMNAMDARTDMVC